MYRSATERVSTQIDSDDEHDSKDEVSSISSDESMPREKVDNTKADLGGKYKARRSPPARPESPVAQRKTKQSQQGEPIPTLDAGATRNFRNSRIGSTISRAQPASILTKHHGFEPTIGSGMARANRQHDPEIESFPPARQPARRQCPIKRQAISEVVPIRSSNIGTQAIDDGSAARGMTSQMEGVEKVANELVDNLAYTTDVIPMEVVEKSLEESMDELTGIFARLHMRGESWGDTKMANGTKTTVQNECRGIFQLGMGMGVVAHDDMEIGAGAMDVDGEYMEVDDW